MRGDIKTKNKENITSSLNSFDLYDYICTQNNAPFISSSFLLCTCREIAHIRQYLGIEEHAKRATV